MYNFSRILVAIDIRYSNKELIRAACEICQLSDAKEVFILNVVKELNLPAEIQSEFPDLIEKAIEERKQKLNEQLEEFFVCKGVKPHLHIKEGQVTKEILKFTAENKIDLILAGRGQTDKGGGVQIQRLARRAACSLLVIPEGVPLKWDKILVPIDFSSYSKMAIEKAVNLSEKIDPAPSIITQNVFTVPVGYHYTGKSYEDFGKIMKENAQRDYKQLINQIKTKGASITDIYTLSKDDDVISAIYKQAKTIKADLIIIGAKGRSSTTAIFIGAKAEKMVFTDSDIPLLIVRPKGKRAGIMEYLKEI